MVLHVLQLLNRKKKYFLFAILINAGFASYAQNYLEVPVMLDVVDGKVQGVLVKVRKNGKDAFTQSGSSKMRLKLDFNKNYTLIFTKDGYITKTIEFDTHTTSERIKSGFEPYTIGVKLYAQESDKHVVMYNQAVGVIKFDPVLDEFNYETDYSKSILSNMSDPKDKEKEKEKVTAEDTEDQSPKEKNNDTTADQTVAKKKKSSDKTDSNRKSNDQPDKKDKGGAIAANDVPPQGRGAQGSEPPPPPSGKGGNDIGTMVAMSEGSDPSGGMFPSAGNDVNRPSTGEAGSEVPAINQYPSSGSEVMQKQMLSSTGNDSHMQQEVIDNINITREDIVEDKRVITIVRVTRRNTTTEFRRVTYRWGGPYYFQDNTLSISQDVFAFYTGVKD